MTTHAAAGTSPERTPRAGWPYQRLLEALLVLLFAGVGAVGFSFSAENEHWVTAMAAFFAALVFAVGLVTIRQGRAIRRENTNVHKLNRLERAALLVAEIGHIGAESDLLAYCQRRLFITLRALQEIADEKLPACAALAEADRQSDWELLVSNANLEIDRELREFSLS